MPYRFTILFLIFVTIVLVAVPTVVWLVCWLTGKCCHTNIPYAPFGWTAAGLAAIVWIIMAYGFFVGRFQLEKKYYDWTHSEIPAILDGYKIVHISDLHLSTFDDRPKGLQHIVDCINKEKADLICFTGDLVTIGVHEAEPYTEILRSLHAKDGVVSVLGNHDFLIYHRGYTSDEERVAAVEQLTQYVREKLGWRLLRNESYALNGLTVAGVDNCSCGSQGFRTIDVCDLAKALEGTKGFRILLTHDPTHWRSEVTGMDIPLTLSGHTHSGQVRIFGKALSEIVFKESAGWFKEGNQWQYINSGLGCTLPIRLNCPGEITVITLKGMN